jgi:hypothetical protein
MHAVMFCMIMTRNSAHRFGMSWRQGGVKTVALPARSPTLNAFVERWLRPAQEECLSKLILFGEGPLSRTLAEPGSTFADYSREQPRLPDTHR